MRQPVALRDAHVVPKLLEFSQTLQDLGRLQEEAAARCRGGDKDACASVWLVELFLRATRRRQLHTEAAGLLDAARRQ